jgi:hypothetical protein
LTTSGRISARTYDNSGKLFCHPNGKPIHPDTIARRFNRQVGIIVIVPTSAQS